MVACIAYNRYYIILMYCRFWMSDNVELYLPILRSEEKQNSEEADYYSY